MVFVVFSALIHGFSGLEEVSCPKATKDSACGFNARVETLSWVLKPPRFRPGCSLQCPSFKRPGRRPDGGPEPGDKSPGYYRASLRDELKTGFQKSKPQGPSGADSHTKQILTEYIPFRVRILDDPLEIALTEPKQSLFRSNRFLILASSNSMLLSIRHESARGPDACSLRGNAPGDQLAPDGRPPGTAAPSLDTLAEER